MWYHYTVPRMVKKIKWLTTPNVDENVKPLELSLIIMGVLNGLTNWNIGIFL